MLSFTSCGKKVSDLWPSEQTQEAYGEDAVSENYTYEFSDSGCSTGVQSADTFIEICTQLKDHEINDSCAYDDREELFLSAQCSGVF
jgi:hypothetical protein